MHIPERDPFEDGTVVRYVRMLSNKPYTYAAIRAAGMWYPTGLMNASALSWEQFSDLLFSEHTSQVEVVGAWASWDDAIVALTKLDTPRPIRELAGETWEYKDYTPELQHSAEPDLSPEFRDRIDFKD